MIEFELTPPVSDIPTEMQSLKDAVCEVNAAVRRWDDTWGGEIPVQDRPLIDGLGLLAQRMAALAERIKGGEGCAPDR